MTGLEASPRFPAIVILHEFGCVFGSGLHFNRLDDFLKDGCAGGLAGLKDGLGVRDGSDGAIEKPPFFLEDGALHAQGLGELERITLEQYSDLFQRQSEKLESDDLFQSLEIAFHIDPVAGIGAAGLQ